MNKQIKVKPNVHRLIQFLSFVEEGEFKIPTFQRDFVWGNKEKLELFDSISKEYPIGSILLWKPTSTFANRPNIGPYKIKHINESSFFYILDGFQRLSTLFGCLTNPHKTELELDQEEFQKNFSVYYDLEEEEFKTRTNNSISEIPVYILIDTFEFLDFIDNLRTSIPDSELANLYIERAKKLSSTLIDYQIPSIEVIGGKIKDAVDIFSRVNSKGIEISSDWMLSALTLNENSSFNLGNLFGELLTDIKEYNFDSIKREVLVQCIQSSFGKIYFDQNIEDLPLRDDFQEVSRKTINSIKKAIQFLFENLLVINRKLLPYNNQLIFLTYFFSKVDSPNSSQLEKLKKWFWITTYSNYFTIFSLSKIRLAFKHFEKFTMNEVDNPLYLDNKDQLISFTTAELPKTVSAGSVRSKALQLFLLNHANEFNSIASEIVETYKPVPLLPNDRSHSSIIPLIIYTNINSPKVDFDYNKQKDLSYVLIDKKYSELCEKYFIADEFAQLFTDKNYSKILDDRLGLIQNMEKRFVTKQLGIKYTDILETS